MCARYQGDTRTGEPRSLPALVDVEQTTAAEWLAEGLVGPGRGVASGGAVSEEELLPAVGLANSSYRETRYVATAITLPVRL